MELTGTREIAADRPTVWAALNDPEVLKASIPGCQEMTGNPEDGFAATVKQKVGPVSATFRGTVQLTNVVPGESYTITGEGKGGAAGFAKGAADVRLEDAPGGTLLSYDVKASVGGKLAQLGSRVIDGFAKKMADQFFDNFKKAVEGPDEQAETPANGTSTPEPEPAPDPAARDGGESVGVAPADTPDRDRPRHGRPAAAAQPAFQSAVVPPASDPGSLWARVKAWFGWK